MPANRDLAIAVKDALASNQVSATIQNNMIRFEADDDGVVRIRAVVNEVYSQQRLNPYDVKFFKVYPTKRSEEHTSELQSLMRISYAVFCLKKKTENNHNKHTTARNVTPKT